jgi:hypothetical protein
LFLNRLSITSPNSWAVGSMVSRGRWLLRESLVAKM